MPKGKKITQSEFIKKLETIYGVTEPFKDTTYVTNDVETTITCEKHGTVTVTPFQLMYGPKKFYCPKCGTEDRLSRGAVSKVKNAAISFHVKASKKHNNKYEYSKVMYVNSRTHVTIVCPIHGDFPQTPAMHLSGNGCSDCATDKASEKYTKPFGIMMQEANALHESKYTYVESSYTNSRTLMDVSCPAHGIFPVTPLNHINNGSGCPKCTRQVSSQEDKLFTAFPEFQRTNRSMIHPYHLDFYSEIHNLAIEINGRYWHSEANGKDATYHLNKTQMCLDKDITLLHFWDDEIDDKLPIIASMINSRIGNTERLYARKTQVRLIDNPAAKEFLTNNHLQGSGNPLAAYGLFIGGELVSVMALGKPRFDKNHEWEILRFATRLNTTVVGGASKLFKAFLLDKNPKSIVTYADRRYSEGLVYASIGFTFSHNSKPSYFYALGNTNISRYQAQKHKLANLLGVKFDPAKSESQNMIDAGFVKVYDCGNKVFTWNKGL